MFHVVNLENSKHLNQFDILKKVSNKIIITENTTRTITDTLDLPYDINLCVQNEHDLSLNPFSYNEHTRTLNLVRYNKAAQAVLLTAFMKNMTLKHYVKLPTYTINSDTTMLPDGRYVIKLTHGARSLSVFTAQVGRYNARAIVTHIDKCMENFLKTRNSSPGLLNDPDVQLKEPATNTITPLVTYFEQVERLKASLKSLGVTFTLGEERYDYEAVDMYKSQGLFAQWHVDEPIVEFRLLRSLKGAIIVMGREDLGEDRDKVSTHIQSEEHFIDYMLKAKNEASRNEISRNALSIMYNEIIDSVAHPLFPGKYGSVDVWVALNNTRWGIFEFQPQYSSLNVPDMAHGQFLSTCLNEFLDVASKKSL